MHLFAWGKNISLGALTFITALLEEFFFIISTLYSWAFQVALVVKNLPVSAGDKRGAGSIPRPGRSPGGGNGILARRVPWTEEPSGLQSMGSQKVRHD